MNLRPYQNDAISNIRSECVKGLKKILLVAPCGAGKTVVLSQLAKMTTGKGNQVLVLAHRQEIIEQIDETFRTRGVNMKLCKIMMMQTATRRIKKIKYPSLIIIDECHHSSCVSYQKIIDAFNKALVLGFTATPTSHSGGLGKIYQTIIETVSAKWLIKNNYLAPYDYYAPSVADLTGLHVKMGEYVTKEVEERLIKKSIFGDVIGYYRQLADGKKAICYCSSVNHSKQMAENFRAAGIPAEHIDGETSKAERNSIVKKFKSGEIRILCNVDLISEGFSLDDCEVAILLRPTKSLTLYIQQSMRCMRYKPEKKSVIIDHVGNYARFGLPDQDREWTLDPKKKGAKKEENEVKVRQCLGCFYTHEWADTCPKCGFIYPIAQRTLEEIREAKLELINEIVMDYETPEDCHSMAELVAYARKKGFKPGWAYFQAKARGIV